MLFLSLFFFDSVNFITFIVVQWSSHPSLYSIPSQTPRLSPRNISPLETISFSESVSQFLFCKEVHCVLFPHVSESIWLWGLIVWLTSFSMMISRSSMLLQCRYFFSFNYCVILHCVYAPHLLYPLLCWWTFRLFPCLDYCK